MSKVFGLDLNDETLVTQLIEKNEIIIDRFIIYDQKFSPIFVDEVMFFYMKRKQEKIIVH